jgi:type II secretory pathway component PulF
VPQVLQQMNDNLDWMQKLGDAFLAQQQDVMDTVQGLRARADAAGNLQTTEQQVVTHRGAGQPEDLRCRIGQARSDLCADV